MSRALFILFILNTFGIEIILIRKLLLEFISWPVLLANSLQLFGHGGPYAHLCFYILVSCSDVGFIAAVRVLIHESILLLMTCFHSLSSVAFQGLHQHSHIGSHPATSSQGHCPPWTDSFENKVLFICQRDGTKRSHGEPLLGCYALETGCSIEVGEFHVTPHLL